MPETPDLDAKFQHKLFSDITIQPRIISRMNSLEPHHQ